MKVIAMPFQNKILEKQAKKKKGSAVN